MSLPDYTFFILMQFILSLLLPTGSSCCSELMCGAEHSLMNSDFSEYIFNIFLFPLKQMVL